MLRELIKRYRALVKEWVDMLHGTITVDSKLGYGSRFPDFPAGRTCKFLSPIKTSVSSSILSDSESSMPMDSGITQNNEKKQKDIGFSSGTE